MYSDEKSVYKSVCPDDILKPKKHSNPDKSVFAIIKQF
jgi:hypothetical protein